MICGVLGSEDMIQRSEASEDIIIQRSEAPKDMNQRSEASEDMNKISEASEDIMIQRSEALSVTATVEAITKQYRLS